MTSYIVCLHAAQFMGVVEEAGADVKKVQKGQRYVCCFDIGLRGLLLLQAPAVLLLHAQQPLQHDLRPLWPQAWRLLRCGD